MADEIKTSASGAEVDPSGADDTIDYVAAIKELKENTVSKERHQQLLEENRKLIRALTNGETVDVGSKPTEVNIDELRKELYGSESDLSNLEYIDKTLKLRQAIMDKGGQDPFLPIGSKVTITAEMMEKAQNAADVLQECVDFAQGDSGIFTAELQRRTKDIMPVRRAR
jgi:hypothetical protein